MVHLRFSKVLATLGKARFRGWDTRDSFLVGVTFPKFITRVKIRWNKEYTGKSLKSL